MPPARLRPLAGTALLALSILLLAPGLGPGRTDAQPAPAQTSASLSLREGEVNILADQIQQIGPGNLLIAVGNVEITRGDTRLLADRVELNQDTGDAVAQGKAVFYDGQDRLLGERIDYNIRTGTGIVHQGSAFSAPYYSLRAERMERVGESVYNIRNGFLTTCEGDDPAWSIGLGSATADLQDWVYGRDASFWVRNVPLIPWFPFFAASIRRERQSGFLYPTFGYSRTRGYTAEIPYYWAINDSQDLTVWLQAYSDLGIGLRADYRYILSEKNQGAASGFVIREAFKNNEDRAWFSGKHTWQITPRMALKIDANVTSDDRVFHDYGDHLQERSTQRADTNIFLSYRWDAWSLVGNVLWYQDLTVARPVELQRVPDIRLRGIRQPVTGLSPLLYEVEASFVNFHRVVGPEGVRVDVHPRLVLPIPLAGFVTLTPSLAGRLTYYDQRLVGQHIALNGGFFVDDSVHDDRVRRQVEFGLQAESRAARVYALDGSGGIAALQHLIEPRANFTFVRGFDQKGYPQYEPAVSRIGLLQSMDPNIDRLNKVTAVEYVLTNRLNAKTVAGPNQEAVRWEMARFSLAQIYDIGRATAGDKPFKDLRGELVYQPTPVIGFRADAAYNVNGLGLREANTDLVASFLPVTVLVGSRFNEVGVVNTVHAELAAQITSWLNVRGSTNWDIQNGGAAENRVAVDLRYQCWAIMVEYVDRHGKDDEVRFSVNLLGLGQTGTGFGTGFGSSFR